MPIKLVVTKADDPAGTDEYVFEQSRITLGRASTNDLQLKDPARVISKQHAELNRRGDTYFLTDNNSKNFTFLNSNRLNPADSYPVADGDIIRLGEYELRFLELEDVSADLDRTMFDPGFVNPFEDDVAVLSATLRSIRKSYEELHPRRRRDALRTILVEALREEIEHETSEIVAGALASGSTSEVGPSDVPDWKSIDSSAEADAPRSAAPYYHTGAQGRGYEPTDRADGALKDRLLDVLLEGVSKLIGAPRRFRFEFIGQTIMQSPKSNFLYEGRAEALKSHLLDPNTAPDDAERRLALLREALDDLAVHQVALLEGYKASAHAGARLFLERIDPERAQGRAEEEGWLNRLFPFLAKNKAVELLKTQWQELRGEDWSAAEQRVFRPAFVNAYLARMTAVRNQDDFQS